MGRLEFEPLAREAAARYSLDPALVCAVIEQESSWDNFACRYEPGFYTRYIQPMIANGQVKTATEATMRATSWGLMQLMGQVAREFGFKAKYLSSLCDPATGIDWGCKKLAHCIQHEANVHDALLRWNGGGNPSYPDEVLAKKAKYELPLPSPD